MVTMLGAPQMPYATTCGRSDVVNMSGCRAEHGITLCRDSILIFWTCRRSHISVYRPLKVPPRCDVHHVAEHTAGPERGEQAAIPSSPEADWTGQRKAMPAAFLFPATARWMASLPFEFQPTAIGVAFPRIANVLASLWTRPDALTSYLNELLIDKRGGRSGFPIKVLRELHALRAYYATLHPVKPNQTR